MLSGLADEAKHFSFTSSTDPKKRLPPMESFTSYLKDWHALNSIISIQRTKFPAWQRWGS
uniref:Uncharacterized protein n=1 Tax=Kalanchoe fedtschenkoi TaxID=63787 RepID=A0A7N0UTC7_KALFE